MSARHDLRRGDPGLRGALRFSRYAYPPNALGYCGPQDPSELADAAEAGDGATVAALAERFSGAYPYLQLIAAANHLGDPLDERVVDAYWLGNPLLEQVSATMLAASLDARFASRAGGHVGDVVDAAFSGGRADHAFHVFAVSPWIGMLRAGRAEPALVVLDRCRIRWGIVREVSDDRLVVACRRLVLLGDRLALGDERCEVVRCHPGGRLGSALDAAATGVEVGDAVSCHWDYACERLDGRGLRRLAASSAAALAAVNATARPGPAIAVQAAGA